MGKETKKWLVGTHSINQLGKEHKEIPILTSLLLLLLQLPLLVLQLVHHLPLSQPPVYLHPLHHLLLPNEG